MSPRRMPPKILARNGGPDGDALVVAAEPVHVDADACPPHILAQGRGSRAYKHWYARMWRVGRTQQIRAARAAQEQDPIFQLRRAIELMKKKDAKRKRHAEYSRAWRARQPPGKERKCDVVIVPAKDADSGAGF